MNDYLKKSIEIIIGLLLVIAFLAMIIIGQKKVTGLSLGLMLLGLAGLVILLYLYNRKYAKDE